MTLAAAAETRIAQNRTTVVVGPLTTVGLLIVSIVMRKGVFPRAVAYLGIAVGALGIASEALRFVTEGLYGVYGDLLGETFRPRTPRSTPGSAGDEGSGWLGALSCRGPVTLSP